jgi:hypothetical protein
MQSGRATLMPKGYTRLLRTIVIIEWGRSLGAGFVYGDSYGEEKNNTAVRSGSSLPRHMVTRLCPSQGSRCR